MIDHDIIIDRSPTQIEKFVSESRIAIRPYGFSIVRTEWLHLMLDKLNQEQAHEHQNPTQTP